MLAVLITLTIFLSIMVVGLSILVLVLGRELTFGEALVAPAVGLSAFVVPTVIANQLGVPVGRFALPLVLLFVVAACAALVGKRHRVPWRSLGQFAPIVALAFALVAWPELIHGVAWVSFSNDDMTNYALAADRLVNQGFYQMPALGIDVMYRGFEPGYWFLYAVDAERTGVEMALALVAGISGLRGFAVFMPFIVAVDLGLICGTASMAWGLRRRFSDAAIVAGLSSVSALVSLGTLYQLLAQVCGLCVLTCVIGFVTSAGPDELDWTPHRAGVVCGLLAAGLLLMYPELSPFAALTLLAFYTAAIVRRRSALRAIAVFLGTAAIAAFLFTLPYFYKMLALVVTRALTQVPANHSGPIAYTFAYYLVPSGVANLWGLLAIAYYPGDPKMSTAIALGMLLSVATIIAAIYLALRRGSAAAIMLLVMVAVGSILFVRRADFGLYKLAMYAQPFLLVVFEALLTFIPRSYARFAVAGIFVAANAVTQWQYVETSQDGAHGLGAGFVEVHYATRDRLLDNLQRIRGKAARFDAFVSDTSNLVLAKYETGYVGDKPLYFVTREFRGNLEGLPWNPINRFRPEYPYLLKRAEALIASERHLTSTEVFPYGPKVRAEFEITRRPTYARVGLLVTTPVVTILNRSNESDRSGIVELIDAAKAGDHLAFVESSLGLAPGPGSAMNHVSLFQVEPDYFRAGTMSGLGRYLLFQVFGGEKPVRVLLELTDSLAADGKNALPPARVFGRGSVSFGLVGSGSARVVSPPLTPLRIGSRYYLGIDMGVSGKRFRVPREGLMGLYGRDVDLDPRVLTAFGRNISLIDGRKYREMRPPTYISDLPAALADPTVLYSGIYEDAWVSNHIKLRLDAKRRDEPVVVTGLVPLIHDPAFVTSARFSVDGRAIAQRDLRVGEFALQLPSHVTAGIHDLDITFSKVQRLPSRDGRPVAARLTGIGFGS